MNDIRGRVPMTRWIQYQTAEKQMGTNDTVIDSILYTFAREAPASRGSQFAPARRGSRFALPRA